MEKSFYFDVVAKLLMGHCFGVLYQISCVELRNGYVLA